MPTHIECAYCHSTFVTETAINVIKVCGMTFCSKDCVEFMQARYRNYAEDLQSWLDEYERKERKAGKDQPAPALRKEKKKYHGQT